MRAWSTEICQCTALPWRGEEGRVGQNSEFIASRRGGDTLGLIMKFGLEDDGREIEVRPRDEFEIQVPETRTAGYRWRAKRVADPACEMVSERSETAPGKVGGSGSHHFFFRALTAGTAEIELHYGRSWEQDQGPAKTFRLKVHVRP